MGWHHLVLRIWIVYLSMTEVCSSTLGRTMLEVIKYQDLFKSSEDYSLENTSVSLEQNLHDSSENILGLPQGKSSRSHENVVIKDYSQNSEELFSGKSSNTLEELSLEDFSKSVEELSLEKSSQTFEESSLEKSLKSLEQSSLEKSSLDHDESSMNSEASTNERTAKSLKGLSQSLEKDSHSMEDKINNLLKHTGISQSSEQASNKSHEENYSSIFIGSGKTKRNTQVLSFKSLDDLIDGIEAQVQQSDATFEFNAEQEIALNGGIEKIKKCITDGDSVEKMNVNIKELEKIFSDLTGFNIEMSFISQLRLPTVMNEAVKEMFNWNNMMMSGTIEFTSLEARITEYIAKLKAEAGMDANFLKFLEGCILRMRSKDFEAGMATLLNWGEQQQSFLPADISSHVTKMEDIINAVETVCKVTLESELKSSLSTMISDLQIAIKEKMGEKELAAILHHLERKLKSAAKRTFDLSFLLDLDLEGGGVVVDYTDWKSISNSLIEILFNTKQLPADQVISRLKVWISKALEKQELLQEFQIRLNALLEQIVIEMGKKTDCGELIIMLKKDIEEDKAFNPNDLAAILVLLKGIISNQENLPPTENIIHLKILISKALVSSELSPENKIKFQIIMEKIEEGKGSGTEPADILNNLTVIIDTQLSGGSTGGYPTPGPIVPIPGTIAPTPGAIVTTPAPIVTTPAPIVPTPGAIVPTPGPIVPTPGPITPTPGPIVPTPGPITPTPGPIAPTPSPIVPTPGTITITDWNSASALLIQILLNPKQLPADQVISEIKVWLTKALEKPDLLPEIKIRLEVLLEQITIETEKNTDLGQLIIILKQDIEEVPTFNSNDLPSIIVLLKGIISNPENLPPNEITKNLKILISKVLVCPDLSPENKIKFQTIIVKIEEAKGSGAEPADIFNNLTVIIDTQLSGGITSGEIIFEDWNSASALLIQILLNPKQLPADQVISEIKVWLNKALEKPDLLPEIKIRLEVLLEQITMETEKNTDAGQLIILLKKDIEEVPTFNSNDLPSIMVLLKGIISNPENLPPDEIIKNLKILISKALVCPDLSPENKIKFQAFIVKIEEVKGSGAETADIFTNLTVIIDTQLSGGITTEIIKVPDVTEEPLKTDAPELTTTVQLKENYENFFRVSFLTCGGQAHATSTWDKNKLPSYAFTGCEQGWHSGRGSKLPQSLWYQFVEPVSVVKVIFSSRNDLRPYKYKFWGSNGPGFDDPKTWTVLYEDSAISKDDKYVPEEAKYEKHQDFVVESPQKFLAYGFQVIETQCKYTSIKNVFFWTIEQLKEVTQPTEEVVNAVTQIREIYVLLINTGIDERETLNKIRAQLSIIIQIPNVREHVEIEVVETIPGLLKEIDILVSMEKLDKTKLIVRMQPLYRILISFTRVISGEENEMTGDEFRLNIKLLRMYISMARTEPENLNEWLFYIRTQAFFIYLNIKGNSDMVMKDWKEVFRLINNIVSDDVNGVLAILEATNDLCNDILVELGKSNLSDELKSMELIIRRIFVRLQNEQSQISSVAIFSQMKPWLLLIMSKEEANGAFSEEAIATCMVLVEMIKYVDDFETASPEGYYKFIHKFLVRFNIIGWLLNDIENKPPKFTKQNFIQIIQEMDAIWARFKGTRNYLEDQKPLMNNKILMSILCINLSVMKIDGIGNNINDIVARMLVILREKMKPSDDIRGAASAAWSVRVMIIRLAYHLKLTLKNIDFTIKIGTSQYYLEVNDKLTHTLAAEACEEMGGHLARPGRKDLEQLIEHAKKHTDRINLFLDATDHKKKSSFQYSTGKIMAGENLWECGQPDDGDGKEHCVVISKLSANRLLNDVYCDTVTNYICQIGESEPDPKPECTAIGEGCYFYDKRKLHGDKAIKECEAMGGIIASPCKKQLDLLIKHTIKIGGRYWIGAYDKENNKKYTYPNGKKLPCGFWVKGQPDNAGGKENCVEIAGCKKGLTDLCCKTDMPFICQFGEDGCNDEKDRAEIAKNCVKIADSCYVIENQEALTWEEAVIEAKLYPNGQLAAPDRNEMRRLIDHVITLGGRYWIAGNDRETEGSYHYAGQQHKMPGGFWGKGEPKGTDDDEDCVEINTVKKGLADMPCSTESFYIVEIIDPSAPPKKPTKPECTKFGSLCFWINEWDELTWEESSKACEATGGYLASPTCTESTKALLEALHVIGGKYWIGATDSKKEGEYKYVTGNCMIQGLWAPGEPNQGCQNQEDCIGIWSNKKGFYDEQCDAKLNYVCQYGEIEPQTPDPLKCEKIGSGCFIIEASVKIDWNTAKAKCESVGAQLAHPTKEQMGGLIEHLHSKGDVWWIGGSDTAKEGHWVYVNGEKMPDGFWNCGEPNNMCNNEGCVEVISSLKKLNDADCSGKRPYVCQVEGGTVEPPKPVGPPEPGCKYEVIGKACFMIEDKDKLSWEWAQNHCEGLGMTLAAPTNEDLQVLLTHMANKGGRYWIGVQQFDDTFRFTQEVPCVWGPGQPEYKDDQKCVEIYAKYKALSDGKCDTDRHFICQDLKN